MPLWRTMLSKARTGPFASLLPRLADILRADRFGGCVKPAEAFAQTESHFCPRAEMWEVPANERTCNYFGR